MGNAYAIEVHRRITEFAESTCGGGGYDEASRFASSGNPNTLIVPFDRVYDVMSNINGRESWSSFGHERSTNPCFDRLLTTGSSTGKRAAGAGTGACVAAAAVAVNSMLHFGATFFLLLLLSLMPPAICSSASPPPPAIAPPLTPTPAPLPFAVFCTVLKLFAELRRACAACYVTTGAHRRVQRQDGAGVSLERLHVLMTVPANQRAALSARFGSNG
eukprot:SAG11_NODE_1569_length_4669_cov_15.982276_3_plen_217_part_00